MGALAAVVEGGRVAAGLDSTTGVAGAAVGLAKLISIICLSVMCLLFAFLLRDSSQKRKLVAHFYSTRIQEGLLEFLDRRLFLPPGSLL